MQTVNIELQPILSGVLQFVSYMVLAVFAENVVLARALGVSRLIKLVPDHRTQVWDFCLPLLLVMTLSALPGWAAHNLFFPWLRDYLPDWLPMSALRPVVYLTCGVAAMAVTWLLLGLLPRRLRHSCRSQLSLATCSASPFPLAAGWAMSLLSTSSGRAAAVCAVRPFPRSFRACPAR